MKLDGPGPYDWECNPNIGELQLAYVPVTGEHVKITGIMHVLNMRINRFETFNAAASVGFENSAILATGVLFQLQVMRAAQDEIKFVLRGDGGQIDSKTLASGPNKETDIPFLIKLDEGIVSVVAAPSSLAAKIGAVSNKPRRDLIQMVMTCSGAHVQFSKVSITSGAQ
ncbi:MAG: hypothetical protein WDM77_15430 [Steroidobacteraceae bacterium]